MKEIKKALELLLWCLLTLLKLPAYRQLHCVDKTLARSLDDEPAGEMDNSGKETDEQVSFVQA